MQCERQFTVTRMKRRHLTTEMSIAAYGLATIETVDTKCICPVATGGQKLLVEE